MASIPLTMAILVLLSVTVGFIVAELASDLKHKGRILKHNVNHALTPILLEIDRINAGMADDAEKASLLLKAMRAWLQPIGEQEIPLRAFCKPLVASYRSIQFYPLADPLIRVDVGELYAIMINCVQNALEAREVVIVGMDADKIADAMITIRLDEDKLQISNPACEADRTQVQKPSGSTRGSGRGKGRQSIRDSCDRIGWVPSWEVAGTRVITTLSFA